MNFTIPHAFCLPLLLMVFLAAPAVADEALIQVVENGRINWSDATAVASGIGKPMITDDGQPPASTVGTVTAARQNAQINLIETVGAIRINAVSRIANRLAQGDDFRNGLHALVLNADITRQECLADGSVEIDLTMKLSGGFGQLMLPEEIRQVDSITAMTAVTETPTEAAADPNGSHNTGLILDAAGIGAKPSLVPVIVDETGEIVYGPAFVSREFAVSQGMCGFATALAAARNDKRVGDRPMVVKAIRTHFTGETDLVISNVDAARLRSSVVYLNLLKACRVIIVMDP